MSCLQDGKAGSPMIAASTLGLLVDLLCFCVQHHQYRVKYYILRSDTVGKVLRLLRRREKWLVVAALRFLRTCIGLKVRRPSLPASATCLCTAPPHARVRRRTGCLGDQRSVLVALHAHIASCHPPARHKTGMP